MNRQSPIAPSAAVAIGSNGFPILRMPKYASVIATTHITEYGNGFGNIEWLDSEGQVVAETVGARLDDGGRHPRLGKVEITCRKGSMMPESDKEELS